MNLADHQAAVYAAFARRCIARRRLDEADRERAAAHDLYTSACVELDALASKEPE
jgi:hypothetical protein